jgi:hypothetical protein
MLMQRARRVALLALLAVLGGLALAGCRAEPAVAVYVGKAKYTHAYVDRVVNEIGPTRHPAVVVNRQWVVRLLVTRDLAKQLAAEKSLTVEPADAAVFSDVLKLPAGSEFAKLWADVYALQRAVGATVTPAPVADDDLLRYYRAGVAAGVYPAGVSDDAVRTNLNNSTVLGRLGLRNLLVEAAARQHVTVNPRFAPLAMPLLLQDSGSGQLYEVAVPFPLDTTTGVRDSA